MRSFGSTGAARKGIVSFNKDLGAARYDKAAADLAWGPTLAFFREHLDAPPRAA